MPSRHIAVIAGIICGDRFRSRSNNAKLSVKRGPSVSPGDIQGEYISGALVEVQEPDFVGGVGADHVPGFAIMGFTNITGVLPGFIGSRPCRIVLEAGTWIVLAQEDISISAISLFGWLAPAL